MRQAERLAHKHAALAERRKRVLRVLADSPSPLGTVDVARLMDHSASRARTDLNALERQGKVERYGSEFGGGWLWMAL